MKHLLSIDDLSREEIENLVEEAVRFTGEKTKAGAVAEKSVGLVFAEPSTRTRVSFERACRLLGRHSVLLGAGDSSLTKNESVEDTFENLVALGCDALVARLPDGVDLVRLSKFESCPIVNAGFGREEHPTQALLDLVTLFDSVAEGDWDALRSKTLVISGDLLHSRVAGSWAKLAEKIGLKIVWNAPEVWRRKQAEDLVGNYVGSREEALEKADVWMALRVQKERFSSEAKTDSSSLEDYIRDYQVGKEDLSKAGCFLMHPGPVNWGIELDADLQDFEKSLILEQVRIGVATRAVILRFLSSPTQI